jgi:hypothetical protein
MNNKAVLSFAIAFALPAAWAASAVFDPSAAPQGTHVQSGMPDCQVSGYVVTCSSYDLAGVGNKNATAVLSATYNGTVLCTNPGGNVAPGQTQYPVMNTSSGSLSPKNGKLTVPDLSSTTNQASIESALMQNTKCPNGKWTKSVQAESLALVGYTYTLTFAGYNSAYITISG